MQLGENDTELWVTWVNAPHVQSAGRKPPELCSLTQVFSTLAPKVEDAADDTPLPPADHPQSHPLVTTLVHWPTIVKTYQQL